MATKTEFCMPDNLAPIAWGILQDLFNYRSKINYERVKTVADTRLHIDLAADREPTQVLFNIHGQEIASYSPDSIQWKYASYKNWHDQKWCTMTWSRSEEEFGLSKIYAKFYANKDETDFDGYIITTWNNGIQKFLRRSGEKLSRGNFWCMPFESLFRNAAYRQHILAYDLKLIWYDRPKYITPIIDRQVVGPVGSQFTDEFGPFGGDL